MHFGADRNLAGPPASPAGGECVCGCGCSEPTARVESLSGENLFAKLEVTAKSVVYLEIGGSGVPDQ